MKLETQRNAIAAKPTEYEFNAKNAANRADQLAWEKKLSMAALSHTLPELLMLQNRWSCSLLYWLP